MMVVMMVTMKALMMADKVIMAGYEQTNIGNQLMMGKNGYTDRQVWLMVVNNA